MTDCIFCKIIKGEIAAKKVMENEKFFAFHDISPIAKTHVLVIPKQHVQSIAHIEEESQVTGIFSFIRDVAKELGLADDGYRVILNTGDHGGQTVMHMHAHIVGGQKLGWPNM